MPSDTPSTDTTTQKVDKSPSNPTPSTTHNLHDNTPTKEQSRLVQPYLGLWAKLSQAFASYAVVFLVISAFQLYRTRNAVEQFTADAKASVSQECYALEKSLSTVAMLPNLAAQGINRGLVNAVEASISQVGYGLVVVLTGLISSLELIMGLLTGTWRCFLVNLADSGIPLLSDVGAEGVQAIDELNDAVLGLLAVPFNGLGELIESKMADPQIGNLVTVPVMATPKIVFCEEALNLVAVDKLASDFRQWIYYGTMALLAAALAVMLGNMVVIWYHHRRWLTHVERVQQLLPGIATESSGGRAKVTLTHFSGKQQEAYKDPVDKDEDPEQKKLEAMRISRMVQSPLLYRFLDWSSKRLFRTDVAKQNIYLWFIHYVTHPPAIVCLFIGLLGLILTFGQIAFIEHMRQNYRSILAPAITNLSTTIFNSVQGAMQTASVAFSTETNSALSVVENDLNEAVFSEIIRAAADLNNALVQVQTTLADGVRKAFGDSIFAKFVGAVLQCLLFNKLEVVERGLSWVRENAHIQLPRITEDMLMMGRTQLDSLVVEAVDTLMDPSSSVRMQKVEDAISGMFTQYENALRRELPLYYGLAGVWLIVLVMGLAGAARAAGAIPFLHCLTDG
ncbi:plasma membrane fusion protein prm1 [Mortierella hygrophila]|uniref:Plasma membrane fusion protein PRM1 n=1 Tax=Mortierella hygrophila TaxID=979708 RepID=A0A9P6K5D5_9FUNG|nr:plasma membrane fusion protein prm1 [Mortierella hygrophila]